MTAAQLFSKDMTGKTIVLLPRENAVSHRNGKSVYEQAIESTVIAQKRTNLTIILDGREVAVKYLFNEFKQENTLDRGNNYSYAAFESWEAMHNYRIKEMVLDQMREVSVGHHGRHLVSVAQAKEIAKIMGWDVILASDKHQPSTAPR